MVDNDASASSGQAVEGGSEGDYLMRAATILRTRYERDGRYPELTPSAANDLGDTLTELATASDGADREEAIALAHRLVDDDHPELSPMWPSTT